MYFAHHLKLLSVKENYILYKQNNGNYVMYILALMSKNIYFQNKFIIFRQKS